MSNRLKDETSPYLLQHAENPVDWYPWGEEAFAKAEAEDKPIFLSIGYAACHWCHVMAHESFEDPETAAIMNEHFVNIKVDREERPDVDTLYMDAVVAMTGHGGWPMSVFLTPDGKPFYGGTYFPLTRRYTMPSFIEVLQSVLKTWDENRDSVLETGQKLIERIAFAPPLRPSAVTLDPRQLDRAADALFRTYDWTHGGWGGKPKFPQPMTLSFLLQRHFRHGDKLALEMATHSLAKMADGGIYDHLGGGFARYAVDERWLVPHFEKMLYDNAQLARVYLHAWQVTGQEAFKRVAEETLTFLMREMRDPQGGFFSSLDADSEGEEGKYYLWASNEIQVELDAERARLFIDAYGVTENGNFEGRNILFRAVSMESLSERFNLDPEVIRTRLAEARRHLRKVRESRVLPGLDDKVLTAWNGLALITLSEAARALNRDDLLRTAQKLADFLLSRMVVAGRLKRSWRQGRTRHDAFLEDHAALGEGLLALYQSDFNPRWYQAAIRQAEEILLHFSDPNGGFFDTRDDHQGLITRPKSLQDNPTPSGNTLAVSLFLKLAALNGETRFANPADVALRAMQDTVGRHPSVFPGWLCAVDFALGPQLQLALVGDPASHGFQALEATVRNRYLPRLVVAGAQPGSEGVPSLLHGRPQIEDRETAYLCQGFACNLPTTSPKTLQDQLAEALHYGS